MDPYNGFTLITEYVGLRDKCYSSRVYNVDKKCFVSDKKICKGVPKAHVKKNMNFDDYLTCLLSDNAYEIKNIYSFRSKKLHMYSIISKKKALSSNDDKRILRNDSFDTYAIGHYKTL